VNNRLVMLVEFAICSLRSCGAQLMQLNDAINTDTVTKITVFIVDLYIS